MSTAAVPVSRSLVLADVVPGARVRDAALVLTGAGLIAAIGQLAVPLPFTPVPLTLGTFAVLFVGAALGPVRGALSVVVYMLAGLAGAPVFADGASGWAMASFGYVLGYLPAAAVLGHLARRGGDRSPWRTALAAVGASALVYVPGVLWLMAFLGIGLPEALALGVVPFLIGDVIKAVAAALVLPGAWALLGERGRAPRR
ncbi:biotin transporter BioY [Georgenia sp. EYE_87]|uniref:biotin transporter BioY n=1 Tax=Georgenia sp. EYE_87 TaxID=2853448 RepID=UPI002002EA07|nr:biotin transporter BioY [Georgenia sp. EYE_87]MCK6209161.1 biotin transporter BioY [Georgenia sp. EYE_87]